MPSPSASGNRRRRDGKVASLLTEDLLAALAERVKAPPEDGGVWSGPKVATWMARHFGLSRTPNRSQSRRSPSRSAGGRRRIRPRPPHEESRRGTKTRILLHSAEAAAMLFRALMASGQIAMRRLTAGRP